MIFFFLLHAQAEENASPQFSVTVNPKQILNTFGEVSVEYALAPNVGVGGLAGFGTADSEFQYDLGIHGRYYILGDFTGGISAGGQFVYFNIIHRNNNDNVDGHFLYPSTFLSGKYVFDIGFTIDSLLGVTYTTAIVNDKQLDSTIVNTDWDILFNVNLGWSF